MLYKIAVDRYWAYPEVKVTSEELKGPYSYEEATSLVEKMAQQECNEMNIDGEDSFRCQSLGDRYDMATLLWIGDDYQVVTGYNIVEVETGTLK